MANPQQIDLRILEKAADERQYTLGCVYEPGSVDTQGEFAKAAEIESAAWAFMERLQGMAKAGTSLLKAALAAKDAKDPDGIAIDVTELREELSKGAGLDDMHLQVGDEEDLGVIVESYIAPVDMQIGTETVKKGAWLMGVRWSDAMWKRIKKGERTGLSMYGSAGRIKDRKVEA